MNRIFGISKPVPVPGPPPPSLTEASESIDKRVGAIDAKIRDCDAELVKYKAQMSGPAATAAKTRALTVLKRKKMYEQQRDSMLGTQFNVDQAQFATENMKITAITVDAMRAGAAELKQQYNAIKIDQVEDVMDDLEDLHMDQEEMNELLSRPYAVPDFDETEFENELNQLEEEVAFEKMHGGASAVPSYLPDSLPGSSSAVPSTSLPSAPTMMR
jgi:charged multivesicular body protein 5